MDIIAVTAKATAKLTRAPTAPKAFGEIPRNQLSSIPPINEVPGMKKIPLCWNTYSMVTPIPDAIPQMAALSVMCLEKIPIINAGNMELAAKPNAIATVPAAKPGGLSPR